MIYITSKQTFIFIKKQKVCFSGLHLLRTCYNLYPSKICLFITIIICSTASNQNILPNMHYQVCITKYVLPRNQNMLPSMHHQVCITKYSKYIIKHTLPSMHYQEVKIFYQVCVTEYVLLSNQNILSSMHYRVCITK